MDKTDAAPYVEEQSQPKTPFVNGHTSNITDSGQGTISKANLDKERYSISSGIAVVINNIEFARNLNLPDRRGSDVDASSLFQRFQELGFDSDLLNDVSKQDIEEKFKEIKDDKNSLRDAGCLVVAFLTHGNEDSIYATDEALKIKGVMEAFNAQNCPELHLKPKIFIFQACRGSGLGGGQEVRVIRDPNQSDAAAEHQDYDMSYGEIIRIPNEADFLAVYSTSEGYGSFRNTEKGSPFVRYLSEELLKMKKGDDFYKVLTRVNKKVGMYYKPSYPNSGVVTQMPCFISHLTKDLVLKQQ